MAPLNHYHYLHVHFLVPSTDPLHFIWATTTTTHSHVLLMNDKCLESSGNEVGQRSPAGGGKILKEVPITADDIDTEDVIFYAKHLGIDPLGESQLLWIAQAGLLAPLPADWVAVEDNRARLYYYNHHKGVSSWEHPSDEYYRRLVTFHRKASTKPSNSLESQEVNTSTMNFTNNNNHNNHSGASASLANVHFFSDEDEEEEVGKEDKKYADKKGRSATKKEDNEDESIESEELFEEVLDEAEQLSSIESLKNLKIDNTDDSMSNNNNKLSNSVKPKIDQEDDEEPDDTFLLQSSWKDPFADTDARKMFQQERPKTAKGSRSSTEGSNSATTQAELLTKIDQNMNLRLATLEEENDDEEEVEEVIDLQDVDEEEEDEEDDIQLDKIQEVQQSLRQTGGGKVNIEYEDDFEAEEESSKMMMPNNKDNLKVDILDEVKHRFEEITKDLNVQIAGLRQDINAFKVPATSNVVHEIQSQLKTIQAKGEETDRRCSKLDSSLVQLSQEQKDFLGKLEQLKVEKETESSNWRADVEQSINNKIETRCQKVESKLAQMDNNINAKLTKMIDDKVGGDKQRDDKQQQQQLSPKQIEHVSATILAAVEQKHQKLAAEMLKLGDEMNSSLLELRREQRDLDGRLDGLDTRLKTQHVLLTETMQKFVAKLEGLEHKIEAEKVKAIETSDSRTIQVGQEMIAKERAYLDAKVDELQRRFDEIETKKIDEEEKSPQTSKQTMTKQSAAAAAAAPAEDDKQTKTSNTDLQAFMVESMQQLNNAVRTMQAENEIIRATLRAATTTSRTRNKERKHNNSNNNESYRSTEDEESSMENTSRKQPKRRKKLSRSLSKSLTSLEQSSRACNCVQCQRPRLYRKHDREFASSKKRTPKTETHHAHHDLRASSSHLVGLIRQTTSQLRREMASLEAVNNIDHVDRRAQVGVDWNRFDLLRLNEPSQTSSTAPAATTTNILFVNDPEDRRNDDRQLMQKLRSIRAVVNDRLKRMSVAIEQQKVTNI